MTDHYAAPSSFARRFVATVRDGLAAEGRSDVRVRLAWVEENVDGHRLILHVPIAPDLTVPMRPRDGFAETNDAAEMARHVAYFVRALINLTHAQADLKAYAEEMRTAAYGQVAEAQADGLDLLLIGFGFKSTSAFHLSHQDWLEAADHVVATVSIRRTSGDLGSETAFVVAEEVDDLVEQIEMIRDEQRDRQEELDQLAAEDDADLVA